MEKTTQSLPSAFQKEDADRTDNVKDEDVSSSGVRAEIATEELSSVPPVPYKGFDDGGEAHSTSSTSGATAQSGLFAGLAHRLRRVLNPRSTDIQQLLIKLQAQFQMLDVDYKKYCHVRNAPKWNTSDLITATNEADDLKDSRHPLNNPKLITEVHFVGRMATDPYIVELSNLLKNHDHLGSITELWLNNNLISDDGAASIASFLETSSCALVELWLGDNRIGPTGTALIAAALSNNAKLKCLGLYLNPIGNGGASTLAQMLRKNHTLSTLDIHGCGNHGKKNEVLEGYGCKVVKAKDGTEYVATSLIPRGEVDEGIVTDQRLLDAIQTFVAFNRIDPMREQAIRGFVTRGQQDKKIVSEFISELSCKPPKEKLSDEEKTCWKNCEWERLYMELEEARAVKEVLLKDEPEVEDSLAGTFPLDVEENQIGRHLDDEFICTDSRSWRDLKLGITGSAK